MGAPRPLCIIGDYVHRVCKLTDVTAATGFLSFGRFWKRIDVILCSCTREVGDKQLVLN